MHRATAAALLCAGAVITAGCASGSAAPTTGSSASAQPDVSSTGSTSGSPSSKAVQISVSVKDGKVSPATHRVKIAKGSQVRLIVTSDVDDEAHVHGYEIEKELMAGQPTTIEFTADQQGLFEVETHESGLQLLQLEVS
ncbi:MAG: cupredoxin domain-containing protein [Actinomycetes bacterium]